jgi:hypothetical protein
LKLDRVPHFPHPANSSRRRAQVVSSPLNYPGSRPRSVLALVIALCACHDRPATPVQRARATSGVEVRWAGPEVSLEPVSPPPSTGISPADLVAALTREAEAWNTALMSCNAPRVRVGELREAGAARDDGRSVVVVRADRWCPPDGAAFGCYEPSREAITHVRPYLDRQGPHAGEIREADIEVNAVDFRWSLDGGVAATRSLRAVLAHELGHVLGLAHACSNRNGAPDRLDAVALPPCTPLAEVSIMYPDPTKQGRPSVLVPTPDVVAGLCRPPKSGPAPP